MKKIFVCLVLTISIILNTGFVKANQDSFLTSIDYKNEEDYVVDFAKSLFEYYKFNDERIFQFELNELLESYITIKKDILDYNSSLYGLSATSMNTKSIIREKIEYDNYSIYTINVQSEFHYTSSPDILSSIGTDIIIKIDKNNDAFIVDKVYDEISGIDLEMWSKENTINKNIEFDTYSTKDINVKYEDLKIKAEEIKNRIKEIYKNETMKTKTNNINNLPQIQTYATSINKSKVKTYARNNYNKTNPSSGGSSVPYYDFSKQ